MPVKKKKKNSRQRDFNNKVRAILFFNFDDFVVIHRNTCITHTYANVHVQYTQIVQINQGRRINWIEKLGIYYA